MLKTPLKLLIAASVALPGTLAFSADADARPHKKNYKAHHYYGGHHYRNNHHSRVYYYPRHSGGYYYGGHYGHHGHGKAGKYLGVALLGLGLGYVLSKSNDRDDYGDERYEDDYYQDRYAPRYASPPPPGYRGQGESEPYSSQSFDFSQCLETREYQTTIFIDGQEQQAFGTACLMPDGTWVAGPMQIEP